MKRMTIQNANGTYRLPLSRAGSFRQEWQQEQTVLYGDLVDRLGAYEDLGTPQELAQPGKHSGAKK